MNSHYSQIIASEFRACVINTLTRLEEEDSYRPFHRALLSEEALFWSRFERSFSTSFGQRVIEKISKIAAISGGASEASNQHEVHALLAANQLKAIEEHISSRRSRTTIPANWLAELAELQAITPEGPLTEVRVILDLWWFKDGINHFMSIKTSKPNIDQTAEAKRDLLKLMVANPNCRAFFGLYYNPYGEERTAYNFSPPKKVFNFQTDPVVLIGKEYWDTLGGAGFYEELLLIAAEVGQATRAELTTYRQSMLK